MAKQGDRPVLVVDGDDAFRGRVVRVLRRAGLTAVEARSGEEALELSATRPGAVVLEVELPDVDGLEVCHELRQRHGEDLPVIMVSAERVAAHDRVAALLIGADDYLVKPINDDELLARLRRLLIRTEAGKGTHRGEHGNGNGNGNGNGDGLSPREVEVLALLAQGVAAESIADRLVISQKTVSSHLQRVMGKLGVHTRAQAVAEAYRIGLVNGDFEGHGLEPEAAGARLARRHPVIAS
jgi:DNA-binding NarL/FixJ family response regulator